MVKHRFTKGSLVEVQTLEEGFQCAWFEGTIIENPKFGKCMVEYTHMIESEDNPKPLVEKVDMSCVRPPPPSNGGDQELIGPNDVVDVFSESVWWTGVVVEVVGDLYLVYFDDPPDETETHRSNLRLHYDWGADGIWKRPKLDNKRLDMLLNRRQRWLEEQESTRQCVDLNEEKDNNSIHVEEIVKKECITSKADMSIKKVNNELSLIKYEPPEKQDQREQISDQHISNITGGSTKQDRISIGKRGRPKKLLTGEGSIGTANSPRKTAVKDMHVMNNAELSVGNDSNADHFQLSSEQNMKLITPDKKLRRGRRRQNESLSGTEYIPLSVDHTDATVTRKRRKGATESLPNENEEISKTVDSESRCQGDTSITSQCLETNDEGGEPFEINQSLPFVKCSPVWKTLESMDVLKKMPQNPHFSPLLKSNVETREGSAIGHMVTFCNMLKRIAELKLSDPSSSIESMLATLSELESHGFDVWSVRANLTEFLSKKGRAQQLQEEYNEIEKEISGSVVEKDELEQQIRELEGKLGELASRKKMKETEISNLQLKQNMVSEKIQGLELDHQSTVGCLP